jgi:diaminopimelate decarboxylase
MNAFHYQQGVLCVEDVALPAVADAFGTPCYVYSRGMISENWRAFDAAFGGRDHLICYAVKANSNLAVLNVLARLGSGFDIVSGGELERVMRAGGDPGKVVFSGVGKTRREIHDALTAGIYCFNVESADELARINDTARTMGLAAPVSVRVNPDIDPRTHPYIATGLRDSKFGVDIEQALDLYREASAMSNIKIRGLACHIGSQLTSTTPFIDAVTRLFDLLGELDSAGIELLHVDFGGGLGIAYHDERPPTPGAYVTALLNALADRPFKVLIEPGRAVVGTAGVLLTRIEYIKPGRDKGFAIVDAGMNDLLRPALYKAWHDIVPVQRRNDPVPQPYDVVGPVCETGDFLGLSRSLPAAAGDLLAVTCAGAYGFVMSSNYNTRPRAAEVMIDGGRMHLIRARETLDDLLREERVLPE